MVKNRYFIIFICLILLLYSGAKIALGAEDYTKNIETGEANIDFSKTEFPPVAYLYVEFKNNGDQKISNLNFEISYYDKDNYLVKKCVIKNALNEALGQGENKKYKICLNGDVFNIEHEQYPYSQSDEVNDFKIRIISVKFARK